MRIETGIGLAGFIIGGLGAAIPIYGLYIGWLALLVVSIAGLCGEKGLSIATVVLSAFAFIFFTPSLWIEIGLPGSDVVGLALKPMLVPTIAFLIAPIVSIYLFSTGKFVLMRPKVPSDR